MSELLNVRVVQKYYQSEGQSDSNCENKKEKQGEDEKDDDPEVNDSEENVIQGMGKIEDMCDEELLMLIYKAEDMLRQEESQEDIIIQEIMRIENMMGRETDRKSDITEEFIKLQNEDSQENPNVHLEDYDNQEVLEKEEMKTKGLFIWNTIQDVINKKLRSK